MSNANPRNPVRDEQEQARAELAPTRGSDDPSRRTSFVACLLLVPSDAAKPIVAFLEQLAARAQTPIPYPLFPDSGSQPAKITEDHWL